jgi:hypothetical protein
LRVVCDLYRCLDAAQVLQWKQLKITSKTHFQPSKIVEIETLQVDSPLYGLRQLHNFILAKNVKKLLRIWRFGFLFFSLFHRQAFHIFHFLKILSNQNYCVRCFHFYSLCCIFLEVMSLSICMMHIFKQSLFIFACITHHISLGLWLLFIFFLFYNPS